MELTCELSPLAYQALYQTLAHQTDFRSAAVGRIEEAGGTRDTLQDLSHGYQALWKFEVDQAAGDPAQLWAVDQKHARLATWVLASLRHRLKRPSEDFSGLVRDIIADEMQKRFGSMTPPEAFQATVLAWTLGQVRGRLDVSLPAIPAIALQDPDVALAYTGLIVHLLDLQGIRQPWPEVASSATVWRSAGIIDGLKTQKSNLLWPAIEEAMHQATDVIPPLVASRLKAHWIEFQKIRNGLTHIWKRSDEYAFRNLVAHVGEWRDIELSIRGITYFVFSEVSHSIFEDADFGADRLLEEVFQELSSYLNV
jgi:hypothetical protein